MALATPDFSWLNSLCARLVFLPLFFFNSSFFIFISPIIFCLSFHLHFSPTSLFSCSLSPSPPHHHFHLSPPPSTPSPSLTAGFQTSLKMTMVLAARKRLTCCGPFPPTPSPFSQISSRLILDTSLRVLHPPTQPPLLTHALQSS